MNRFLVAMLALTWAGIMLAVINRFGLLSEVVASWAQAIGTVAGIFTTAWIAHRATQDARERDARDKSELREAAAAIAQNALFMAQATVNAMQDCNQLKAHSSDNSTLLKQIEYSRQRIERFPTHELRSQLSVISLDQTARLMLILEKVFARATQYAGATPNLTAKDHNYQQLMTRAVTLVSGIQQQVTALEAKG